MHLAGSQDGPSQDQELASGQLPLSHVTDHVTHYCL